jgi:predicted nucleic acid-binding protein
VSRFIVDASVAMKWLLLEPDSHLATLLKGHDLAAPDLLVAECANALWKHVRQGNLTIGEATRAAVVLSGAGIELVPMQALMAEATRLAVAFAHPAYDCFYLALAAARGVPLVVADESLRRKLASVGWQAAILLNLTDVARLLGH